jgi:hypothetical protein
VKVKIPTFCRQLQLGFTRCREILGAQLPAGKEAVSRWIRCAVIDYPCPKS